MNFFNTKVDKELSQILSLFHPFSGLCLLSVRQRQVDGCLERLLFDFGSSILVVIANADDDSINVTVVSAKELHSPNDIDVSQLQPWKDFINKSFAWGWVTINQQSYCDGVLLSFGNFIPELALTVVASSIKVGRFIKATNLQI